jgi:transcriptional regulator with XRE-family HTH domain
MLFLYIINNDKEDASVSSRDIGLKIQLAREERGMSQEQLARALGCSQSALSNYEKGKRRLYLSHLEKLSEILDKPLEYFMESRNGAPGAAESGEYRGQFMQLINSLYKLSEDQVKDVHDYVEYIRWKANRR